MRSLPNRMEYYYSTSTFFYFILLLHIPDFLFRNERGKIKFGKGKNEKHEIMSYKTEVNKRLTCNKEVMKCARERSKN